MANTVDPDQTAPGSALFAQNFVTLLRWAKFKETRSHILQGMGVQKQV